MNGEHLKTHWRAIKNTLIHLVWFPQDIVKKEKSNLKKCKRLFNSYIMKAGQKLPVFSYRCR